MKAVIEIDVPEWQIGQEVSIYFPDTMYIKATVKDASMQDFIFTWLREVDVSPCNYIFDGVSVDEYMSEDGWCEDHCGHVKDDECWRRYFEKLMEDKE